MGAVGKMVGAPEQRLVTSDATAVASDIADGKTAYVNGVKVTGTDPGNETGDLNRVLIDYTMPVSQAGAYVRTSADCSQIYPNLVLTSDRAMTLDANGFVKSDPALGWNKVGIITGVPARSGSRRYTVYGKTKDAAPTADSGLIVEFNYTDASNTWNAYLVWSGSVWEVKLADINATTWTQRGSTGTIAGTVDWPCYFELQVIEAGGFVIAYANVYEIDSREAGQASTQYYDASRFNKDVTPFNIGFNNVTDDEILIRGIRADDLVLP